MKITFALIVATLTGAPCPRIAWLPVRVRVRRHGRGARGRTAGERGRRSRIRRRARRSRPPSAARATPTTARAAARRTRSCRAQHPDYLVKQLQRVQGRQPQQPGDAPAGGALSHSDMNNVAAFYGVEAGQAGVREEQGPRLARRADLPRRHRGGERPLLLGLPRTERRRHPFAVPAPRRPARRLRRSAAGSVSQRCAAQHPVMTGVAAKLNDREIKAVADYVAGLR